MKPNCADCPFAKAGQPPHRPVCGAVPSNAIGLLVGESPGNEEVERGEPFVGATGMQLDQELLEAGLPRHKLAIVNATLCRPPIGKDENMMRRAVDCCRPAFLESIGKLPSVFPVFSMGKWAAYALTGRNKGAMGRRGFVDQTYTLPRAVNDNDTGAVRATGGTFVAGPRGSAKRDSSGEVRAGEFGEGLLRPATGAVAQGSRGGLIISWHPTFAFFRAPYEWGAFSADIKRFGRLVRGELEHGPQIETFPASDRLYYDDPNQPSGSATTLARLLSRLSVPGVCTGAQGTSNSYVAVDIETGASDPAKPWTGKSPTYAAIKTIAFGTPDYGISLEFPLSPDSYSAVRRILLDPLILKVFQNGPYFDIPILKRYGFEVVNYIDTRDMRRCLSSTSRLSLAYMASLYCDFPPWKATEDDK